MNKTAFLVFVLVLVASTAASTTDDLCSLVHNNLIRHAEKMVKTFEKSEFTRSFIETIKMNKVLPYAMAQCSLQEYESFSFMNPTSQELLTSIYKITKQLVDAPQDYSLLLKKGIPLITYINKLIEVGLDESTSMLEASLMEVGGTRTADAWSCVICGAILKLAQNDAQYKKQDIANYLGKSFCKLFPDTLTSTCNAFVRLVGPYVVVSTTEKYNPDYICRRIGACTGIYTQCNIDGYSNPNPQSPSALEWFLGEIRGTNPPLFVSPWKWVVELYKSFSDDHLPLVDFDQDGFSTEALYRGYNWRGYDCNDFLPTVRPGVQHFTGDQTIDYNCNGIYGVNTVSGKNYKEELCEGSQQYGIITFGDSAGAHFQIPPAYLNVTLWDEKPFSNILEVVANSFDLPMKSGTTGYEFNQPHVNSLYKKLLENNRCNRNDYQNLGVNGAYSVDTLHNVQAVRRNQTTDFPVFMVFELIGNDVCDPAHSFDSMTRPSVFREKILEIWNYIDSVIPAGSHMIIWGVADGRILYETLKDSLEPIGISYPAFYNYLNCLSVSPCWGYMNTDAETRDLTADWAASLNQVYRDILADETIKFNNFDIVYYDLPIKEIIGMALANGFTAADIIEPVDGFHPSQLANEYLAEVFWENIVLDHPDWIPKQNPNNAKIDALFSRSVINNFYSQ